MRKILCASFAFMILLMAKVSEAANVAVVLDVPKVLYTSNIALASVDKSAFKAKFPAGSVFQSAKESVESTKKYRISSYNAEMSTARHNGFAGYAKEFTLADLRGIATSQNSDYVMFIKTYGVIANVKRNDGIKASFYGIKVGKIGNKEFEKTELDLYFNCKVYNAKTNSFELEEKFKVNYRGDRLMHSLTPSMYQPLYEKAFIEGMLKLDAVVSKK